MTKEFFLNTTDIIRITRLEGYKDLMKQIVKINPYNYNYKEDGVMPGKSPLNYNATRDHMNDFQALDIITQLKPIMERLERNGELYIFDRKDPKMKVKDSWVSFDLSKHNSEEYNNVNLYRSKLVFDPNDFVAKQRAVANFEQQRVNDFNTSYLGNTLNLRRESLVTALVHIKKMSNLKTHIPVIEKILNIIDKKKGVSKAAEVSEPERTLSATEAAAQQINDILDKFNLKEKGQILNNVIGSESPLLAAINNAKKEFGPNSNFVNFKEAASDSKWRKVIENQVISRNSNDKGVE